MKQYEERIEKAYNLFRDEYPAVYNTAIEHEGVRNIMLNHIHIKANVDKVMIIKYLNANTDIKYKLKK